MNSYTVCHIDMPQTTDLNRKLFSKRPYVKSHGQQENKKRRLKSIK